MSLEREVTGVSICTYLQMPDGTQRFKCRGQSSWHKHSQVRGRTADSVRFPPGLVHAMGRAIHETYTSGAW